jgi:sugar lactone lactonase YvrE
MNRNDDKKALMRRSHAGLIAGIAMAAAAIGFASPVSAADVLGTKPNFVSRPLSDVPNAAAIGTRIWAPDLDEGFVPQGLAYVGGQLALSAYRSTDRKQGRGPCRLFFMSPVTGAVARRLDLPETCGHAGGVAALADGRVVVADTHSLYVVSGGRVTATVALKGQLRGSFADSDGHALWIGSYDRSGGTLWRIPPEALARTEIDESAATKTLPIPPRVQGLAFDRKGGAWLTVSGSRDGALLRIDPDDGRVLATYAMPAGIEDIAVDGRGLIWAVSESGSIRWSAWSTNFPLVFAIDPARLH